MAKFSELKEAVVNVALSGGVPFIRGLHGIGKSEMMEGIAEEIGNRLNKDVVFHIIDAAHLKEGEITGMPITTVDKVTGQKINDYTLYHVFNEIMKESQEGQISVLAVDEVNRTELTVFNELMPIILAKRVQETQLPDSLYIIAAGNPEDITQYKGATEDYNVRPMDPALKDRFFIFDLEVDSMEWLKWATTSKRVDMDVVEYISEYSNMLHFLSNKEVNPTPRGWVLFSDAYRTIKKYVKDPDELENTVILVGGGKIGTDAATNFVRFLRESKNPLLKVKDFFDASVSEKKFSENLEKLKKEKATRQYVTVTNVLEYFLGTYEGKTTLKKNEKADLLKRFTEILWVLPKDIMLGTIKEIKERNRTALTEVVAVDPKKIIEIQQYISG